MVHLIPLRDRDALVGFAVPADRDVGAYRVMLRGGLESRAVAAPNRFTLKLAKADFKFAAAHFTWFADGSAERLHGHNYRVSVAVSGARLASDGMLVEARLVKDELRRLCAALDERVLLPAPGARVAIAERDGEEEPGDDVDHLAEEAHGADARELEHEERDRCDGGESGEGQEEERGAEQCADRTGSSERNRVERHDASAPVVVDDGGLRLDASAEGQGRRRNQPLPHTRKGSFGLGIQPLTSVGGHPRGL